MIYFSFNHLSVAYGRRELLREMTESVWPKGLV